MYTLILQTEYTGHILPILVGYGVLMLHSMIVYDVIAQIKMLALIKVLALSLEQRIPPRGLFFVNFYIKS